MSYSITDSIAGRPIEITYGAAQLALPQSVTRGRRTRVVRQHLAGNHARFALVVRDSGGTESWWAGDTAGVSVAAAIESWLAGEQHPPEKCEVFLALDVGVYAAAVEQRLVVDERILPTEKALAELHEASGHGRVVYVFAGGHAQQALARQIPPEPLPFDPFEHVFVPAWKVFARNGILHPAHLVGAAAGAVLIAALLAMGPAAERMVRGGWHMIASYLDIGDGPEVQTGTPATVLTPAVDHSASRHLQRLAGVLFDIRVLYRDGIASLTWRSGRVTLTGNSQYAFPDTARQYALATGSDWSYTTEGWTIAREIEVEQDREPPSMTAEEGIRTLLAPTTGMALASGPDAIRGSVNLLANTVTRTLHRTAYRASLDDTAIGSLMQAARTLEGMPAALRQADCAFADWQIANCELLIEVTTL